MILRRPAARMIARGEERLVLLEDVEALLESGALVIDACRNLVRDRHRIIPLATRPVLFALARTLAEAWPGDVSRDKLLTRAFRARHVDESHRARLRVEIGRLRAELRKVAEISATRRGFVLTPCRTDQVAVLARLSTSRTRACWPFSLTVRHGQVLPWRLLSVRSPRTVQRALEQLAAAGKVQSFGRGRARRWTAPSVPGFPTALLLPVLCRAARIAA